MTYFLYLVILPALLYAAKERRAFWEVMVSTAIAHYTVYFISVLMPVESPHFSLASIETVRLAGGFFTHLINWLESYALVRGAAFPSAQVAGSTVAILASWRYRRWLFWICPPLFLCMCVATVTGDIITLPTCSRDCHRRVGVLCGPMVDGASRGIAR